MLDGTRFLKPFQAPVRIILTPRGGISAFWPSGHFRVKSGRVLGTTNARHIEYPEHQGREHMTVTDLTFWRDLALILLTVEAILVGLIPLIGLFLAIRVLRWTEGQVREYTRQARTGWRRVHKKVVRVDKTVRRSFHLRLVHIGLTAKEEK